MKQKEFEQLNEAVWQEFENSLRSLQTRSSRKSADVKALEIDNFALNYRRVCQHLAIAQSRRYTAGLIDRLNDLSRQGYLVLYRGQRQRSSGFLEFILYEFPNTLRNNAGFVWVSLLSFTLPLLAMTLACYINPETIFTMMDASSVREFEAMYNPDLNKLGRERQSDTDLFMFGYYIYNNIGISFQSFALGLFVGIGSIFVMVSNGLAIGAVSGHLASVGFGETFFPFVIGHGAFELTAIIFSGAAGLKIGYAILNPGELSRLNALQTSAVGAIKIVYGSTLMLLIAAFIEAFWSSSQSLPVSVKYSVGTILWLLVIWYCLFQGKAKHAFSKAS